MISAPVGFQCPECVKGAPRVRTIRSLGGDPYVAYALIAVNVAVFVAGVGRDQAVRLGLDGPDVAHGDWWRLVTSGFLHFDLLHIGFNMLLLWWLSSQIGLERTLGRLRFGVLYAVALLSGSLGVLLLDPRALTGGASGAVFGLMGAAAVLMRRRGIDVMQSGLGGLIVINLLFSLRPGVSIGGHLGGLVGGAIAGSIYASTDDERVGTAACVLLGATVAAASLWVAGHPL
jgi:membrane associated rhomboid family serine protease